ncbi:putative disease resistance protein RGA1 [Silene latifolia]|uniref:putative disease resistance protein RGA1 n=1 Tax=Silene latifolia TaxID=37657 RepID=UPI003D7753D0
MQNRQKPSRKNSWGGSKFTREVRLFFSTSNQLVSPFKDARTIKGFMGELSLIARNHAQFGSIVNSPSFNQTRTVSNVSGSYMSTDMVIGRDGDRDKMVNSLLDSSAAAGIIPVASFVGIGGVGKTTLAQYVYNDEKIKRYFDLQLWVFATQDFNVKDVLRQMVTCATGENALDYQIDQLQCCLFRAIAGKRFLLVLDGVWDDDSLRAKWLELGPLLRVGAQGSQVLLTTRSETVVRIIGTQDPLMVSDLGDDDSLLLFQYVAVTEWHEPGVEAIGKDISKMCPKVPLVIRAIGSLLAGKHTVQEWRTFRDAQLANFASYGHDVMSTLKLSYDQLGTRLRLCVTYCSLFPKGYCFYKIVHIPLWIAMGYVEGEYTNQSLEELAEGYVVCLLNRGFFYCYDRDGHKCPYIFYMHDLMHDLMLSIGGFKYKMADSNTNEFDERVCHVSYIPFSRRLFFESPIITIQNQAVEVFYSPCFSRRIESLRVLRMHGLGISKLPRSVGKLIHLSLEELPVEISKLVALRHLHLFGCDQLSHMPKGLRRLTGLETLSHFVVGKPRTSVTPYGCKAKLGVLTIILVDRSKDIVSEAKAANLDRKKIMDFTMEFGGSNIEDEMVLENLKPGAALEYLIIKNYGGKRLPSWMRDGIHCWLPNLVEIHISECKECIYMCSFGRLPHLKSLTLRNLDKVEYIENGSSSKSDMVVVADEYPSSPLFPPLTDLYLMDITMLKGWWRIKDSAEDRDQSQLVEWIPPFPKLASAVLDMELVISLAEVFLQGISSLQDLSVCGASNVDVKQRQPVILLKNYLPMLRHVSFRNNQMEHLPEEFRDGKIALLGAEQIAVWRVNVYLVFLNDEETPYCFIFASLILASSWDVLLHPYSGLIRLLKPRTTHT